MLKSTVVFIFLLFSAQVYADAGPVSVHFAVADGSSNGAMTMPTTRPTAPTDLVIVAEDGTPVNVSATKPTTLTVTLKNTSDHELTVTHYAANAPTIFTPIVPIELAPGKSRDLQLLVEGKSLSFPARLSVFFWVKDSNSETYRPAQIPLISKDVVMFEPRGLWWHVGEESKPKQIQITNIPNGTKVIGVKSSSDSFIAHLEGQTVSIIPTDTSKSLQGNVLILTDPISTGRFLPQISAVVVPTQFSSTPATTKP